MRESKYELLTKAQRKLIDAAEGAMHTAYNPYSKFYVGAALLTQGGEIISGSNVENAAYGSTICAERAALLRANAQGQRLFTAIAVIARGNNFDTTAVTGPCGSCRQMIYEAAQVSGKNIEVILSTTKKDKIVITNINDLLPLAFGPKELGVDIEQYKK